MKPVIRYALGETFCVGIDTRGVGLHNVKHIKKCQKGMKVNIGEDRKTDYTGVREDRFYCVCPCIKFFNVLLHFSLFCLETFHFSAMHMMQIFY